LKSKVQRVFFLAPPVDKIFQEKSGIHQMLKTSSRSCSVFPRINSPEDPSENNISGHCFCKSEKDENGLKEVEPAPVELYKVPYYQNNTGRNAQEAADFNFQKGHNRGCKIPQYDKYEDKKSGKVKIDKRRAIENIDGCSAPVPAWILNEGYSRRNCSDSGNDHQNCQKMIQSKFVFHRGHINPQK
jgi:hypothetical protein